MKKFRFLLALALIVVMVSSFAMAANTDIVTLKDVDGTNVSYTSGNLTLSFVTTEACYADCPMIELVYDNTKWTPVEVTTDITGATKTLQNTNIGGQTCSNVGLMDGYNFATGANVITVTYEPVADANVIGSTFAIATDWYDYDTGEINYKTKRTYTVTAAQAEEVVVDATKISEGTETIFGKENSYWGVWVGTYSVTPGAKSIKKATVNFAAAGKTFETGEIPTTEGGGAVEFKVAIVGVPAEYATGSAATVTLQ